MKSRRAQYISRLLNEWQRHGKIIIAVDFDDTVSPWKMTRPEDRFLYAQVLDLVRKSQQAGAYIVAHTAAVPSRHPEITAYFEQVGIKLDGINKAPVDTGEFGQPGSKMYANIFLDDRGGLEEAMLILEEALTRFLLFPGTLP